MQQLKASPVVVAGLLISGLAMIAIGWSWNFLIPTSAYWGPEDANELIDAQANLHAKSHGDGTHRLNEQEFAAARERLAKIQHQLDSARNTRSRTGTFLAVFGVLLALGGLALHWTAKQA